MATALKPPTSSPEPSLPKPHKYDSAFGQIRRLLFGRSLPTSSGGHLKLPVFLALPIFSSDALSSNAYATEAILGVLLATTAATGALHFALPIAFGISALLIIVVLSYRQIIFAYPDGGGAYPGLAGQPGQSLPSLVAGGVAAGGLHPDGGDGQRGGGRRRRIITADCPAWGTSTWCSMCYRRHPGSSRSLNLRGVKRGGVDCSRGRRTCSSAPSWLTIAAGLIA